MNKTSKPTKTNKPVHQTELSAVDQDLMAKERMELQLQKNQLEKELAEFEVLQKKLENKSDLHYQMLGQALDAVVTVDAARNIHFYNRAAERMFGYTQEEVIGKNFRDIFSDKSSEQDDIFTLEGAISQAVEVRVRHQVNGLIWVRISTSMVDVEDTLQTILFIQDISEKKQMEEKLQQKMLEMEKVQELMQQKQIEADGQMEAINSTAAFIEFDPEGHILFANDTFLKTMQYELHEIKDKHHKIFVDHAYALSGEYQQFWQKLKAGEPQTGQFKRFTKDGSTVWLVANYTPVKNRQGEVIKVIKLGNDVTKDKIKNVDFEGQINAINTSQAVIEFNLDGTIISANDKFLRTIGYTLEEIQGKHHSMFCEPAYVSSIAYKTFWHDLKEGKFLEGEFMRLAKGGKEIWLQASYNPIFDLDGKPYKVVKFAADVTAVKMKNADFEGQLSAVHKSNAVIEFNLDGTIITANDNFLKALGYTLDEVQGKHHSMFVDPEYARSEDYKLFWESLNNGDFNADSFRRIGKGGKDVYIQASYNPILDLQGRPYKVVKFAVDITDFTVALKSVSQFAGELKEGNFNAQIEVKANGDIGKMIEDNLALRDTLKGIIDEVNKVVQDAGEKRESECPPAITARKRKLETTGRFY